MGVPRESKIRRLARLLRGAQSRIRSALQPRIRLRALTLTARARGVLFAAGLIVTVAICIWLHPFMSWLLELPQWAIVVLLALGCTFAGELLRWVFEWLGDKPQLRARTLEASHIVGYVFGVCGVLYAVVLAFVVVTAWQEYDHAHEVELAEQTAVHSLLSTPLTARHDGLDLAQLRLQLTAYAGTGALGFTDADEKTPRSAINKATLADCYLWPSEHMPVAPQPSLLPALCIGQTLSAWTPTTMKSLADYEFAKALYRSLLENRVHRIHHLNDRLPPIMWGSLVVGAIIVVAFTFLFDEHWTRSQAFRTAALSALIGIMLAEALVFDHPFTGQDIADRAEWAAIECQMSYFDPSSIARRDDTELVASCQ
jgi:hypothetical protein